MQRRRCEDRLRKIEEKWHINAVIIINKPYEEREANKISERCKSAKDRCAHAYTLRTTARKKKMGKALLHYCNVTECQWCLSVYGRAPHIFLLTAPYGIIWRNACAQWSLRAWGECRWNKRVDEDFCCFSFFSGRTRSKIIIQYMKHDVRMDSCQLRFLHIPAILALRNEVGMNFRWASSWHHQ